MDPNCPIHIPVFLWIQKEWFGRGHLPLICTSPQKAFCGPLHGYFWSSSERVWCLHCMDLSKRACVWYLAKEDICGALQSFTLHGRLVSYRCSKKFVEKKNITWIFVDPSKVLHYTDLSQRRPRCWCDRPQCGGTWPSNRQTWQNRTRLVSISKGKGKYNYECKYKYKGFNQGFWSSQNRLHHV